MRGSSRLREVGFLLCVPLFLGVLTGEEPLLIVAFGDSTTARWPGVEAVYAQRLDREMTDARVINAGIPGNTTADALARLDRDVIRQKADIVIVQFGINDSWGKRVSEEDFEANLRTIVTDVRKSGSRVILMTANALWPAERDAMNREYAGITRKVAREMKVPLLDVHRMYTDYEAVEGQSIQGLLPDGVHPNDEGHGMVADGLVGIIRGMEVMPRGYTIPVVDISGETGMQVLVDREEGQYLGHPTTVLLDDGKTMICVYPKGHGKGAIVMKRSTDGGRSWSGRLPTPESWATSRETPTIHRMDGKRLILFSGLYPVRMAISEDEGETWSSLEPVGKWGGIVAMASVGRLADGRYMALFHDDGRFVAEKGSATGFRVYKSLSTDGGRTWGDPASIAHREDVHLCEPGLVRSPDGKRIALLLRENSRTRNSHLIFSDDEGESWSEPRELPGALTGDRHVARYAPDGRLFITFRDTTRRSDTWGDWVGWVGTWEDIVKGKEGQYRVRILDNHKSADCAYSGLELLPDGTFVATTYGHWTEGEPPCIVSVRFRMEDLDSRLKQ